MSESSSLLEEVFGCLRKETTFAVSESWSLLDEVFGYPSGETNFAVTESCSLGELHMIEKLIPYTFLNEPRNVLQCHGATVMRTKDV